MLLANGVTVDQTDEHGRCRSDPCLPFSDPCTSLAGSGVHEGVCFPDRTALHQAATFGHPDVIPQLLAAGADPALEDNDGYTPLQTAVKGTGTINEPRQQAAKLIVDKVRLIKLPPDLEPKGMELIETIRSEYPPPARDATEEELADAQAMIDQQLQQEL